MNKKISLALAIILIICAVVPASALAESVDNGIIQWSMPPVGQSAGESQPHAYDIKAMVNGESKPTTYNNGGYYVRLMLGAGNAYNLDNMSRDTEKYLTSSGPSDNSTDAILGVKVNPAFITGQDYAIDVTFTVTNYSEAPQNFSLGSGADVQIADNDSAVVTALNGGIGFTMLEGGSEPDSLRYVFLGKPTEQFPEITAVDAMGIGKWQNHFYEPYAFSTGWAYNEGEDSAMVFSWKDRTIAAGDSVSFTVVYMLGAESTIELPSAVEKPQATPLAGTYTSPQSVALSSPTTGAEIYYTLDGTEPTSSSTPYTGPIAIGESTTIKAISVKSGVQSEVAQFAYTIASTVVRGTVKYDTIGNPPVADASVTIKKGTTLVAGPVTTLSDGSFALSNVSYGSFNLIVEKDGIVTTELLTVSAAETEQTVIIPVGKKSTVVEVASDIPAVTAGGLEGLWDELSPEDLTELDGGKTIEFQLMVEGEASPAQNIAQSAANALSTNERIGLYLNASLFKIIRDGDTVESNSPVHSITNKIRLVIPVPTDLLGKGPFKIIRVHQDPVTEELSSEILPDLDTDDTTITVETDRFSVYAISYTSSSGPVSPSDPAWVTVTASASNGGTITPTGMLEVLRGEDIAFTFKPDSGYVLSKLLIDGVEVKVSAGNTYVLENVRTNTAVFAAFVPAGAAVGMPNTGDAATIWPILLIMIAVVLIYINKPQRFTK